MKAFGFENVSVIADIGTQTGITTIIKTPSVHGDNEQVVMRMGETSGYLLTGEEKSLYIAGDTVFFKGVAETLNRFTPDVIILNCCEATTPDGRLIMDLHDVESVCNICPEATVIATHLDSVNHALLTSEDIRQFVIDNNLKQLVVPHNGEWIQK
ncbi:MAG: MBL fold metallo-hydrolase [Lachnospiraceae bacterium]|nr:MBL fold metallo-hydrolase [Lachnospiraceae bacterium]